MYDIMRERRSIRKYKPDKIPGVKLERILTAGGLAPSGANRQPWLYLLVDDDDLKREIRRLSEEADERWNAQRPDSFRNWLKNQDIAENSKPFLEEAPLLLCIFGDSGQPYWFESTWISIAWLLLAIEKEGLGTLTYTPGYPDFLNNLLGVPAGYVPQVVLPLGYADEEPPAASRKRKALTAFVHKNTYTQQTKK